MLTQEEITEAALRLDRAEQTRTQIKPLTLELRAMDMQDAYAIQARWVQIKLARGAQIAGYKIGLTSRAMQLAMSIDTPDYGVLLDEMRIPNGGKVVAADFLDPRVEAEFAFVLKKPLEGTAVTIDQVLDATDYVVPALELISARSIRTDPDTGYTRNVFDTVADNAANAGFVPGDARVTPLEVDLRWSGAIVYYNETVEETGLGAAVLDHPAQGIVWVCKRFAAHGIGLLPGQFVLSGSFTRPIAVGAGDAIRADYGALGQVSITFS